jgi:uncharacterized membrane protein YhaH (DUF805 family)
MADSSLFIQKYADFTGRATRTEWVLISLLGGGLIAIGPWLDVRQGTADIVNARLGPWTVMALLIGLLPLLSACVRRLHDTDRSGLWLALAYLPYLCTHMFASMPDALLMARGALILAALLIGWLLLQNGSAGDNRFGARGHPL